MPTTILSRKGEVTIPKSIRTRHNWTPGQKIEIIDTGVGVLLRASTPFPRTTLDQVSGCLPYHGRTKTLEEMAEAIHQGAEG